MTVSPLAGQIIDEQALGKWRIRQQGNKMGRGFLCRLVMHTHVPKSPVRGAKGQMSPLFKKAQTTLMKYGRKKRERLESVAVQEALCAYLKEKLDPVQRLSRRCSTVKARKSQCAAINIANASIIRVTPLASLRWRKCSSAVVFS